MTALAQSDQRKNARTAMMMALIVAAMVGLAFVSVPLYKMFCELTGLDGTPLRAERAPGAVAGEIGVRFDANVQPGQDGPHRSGGADAGVLSRNQPDCPTAHRPGGV